MNTILGHLVQENNLEEYFSSKKNDIDEILFEQTNLLENNFYNNILVSLRIFIANTANNPVVLFDIDDSIISRDLIQEIDYLRPGFIYLVAQLKTEFPKLLFGIISQRRYGPPAAIRHLFDERFIVCSHGYDQDILSDMSYAFKDGSERPIYIEKVNAFLDTSNKYKEFSFFMIDDILSNDRTTGQNPLVSKGYGYAVKAEKFTPEYQSIGIVI